MGTRSVRFLGIVVALLAASVALAVPARAAPVQFGSNYYEFVQVIEWGDPVFGANTDWAAANAAAATMSFGGVFGHLATVTSAAENDFLAGLVSVPGFRGGWLGGDESGWVVGPEAGQTYAALGYANWGGIEPNNSPSKAYMNIGESTFGIAHGQWADATNGLSGGNDPTIGYFVEYESPSAVPEPGTLLLLGSGLAGLGVTAWRRARRS